MNTTSEKTDRRLERAAHGVIEIAETIEDCNDAACRMLEIERTALIGKSVIELSPDIQSDGTLSSERWARRIYAAKAGMPQWFQWQFRRDGADLMRGNAWAC